MVYRPPNDRQTVDLQNAKTCTAWIKFFVAKCRAEKKEDKVNTDGTIVDHQVTNLFLNTCSQDACLKLRSLMSPRNLLDTPFKEIRQAIQNYISLKREKRQKRLIFCPLSKALKSLTTIFYRTSEMKHVIVTSNNLKQ